MNGVSHLAIGVRNMERSVHFYRDLLGLELKYDEMQPVGGLSNLYRNPEKGQRHAVHLHYGKGENAGFLVLTEMPGGMKGEPIKLDDVGISHFSWWVDDINAMHDKLKKAGVKILVPPYKAVTGMTCLFEDPDGIIVQIDQRP